MKYLALILFCLWVLSHVLGAQETADPAGFADRFVKAAEHRLARTVRYDPAYVVLDYPGGDVPADTGVCTDEVIRTISEHQPHVVFMLWGNYAQKKETLIDTTKHLVLKAPHPSPLSAYQGFFGCKHFSQANAFLEGKGMPLVKW